MKKFHKIISFMLVVLMVNLLVFLPDNSYAASKSKVNLKGTYHAALGIQTCNILWIQRWGYFNKTINPQYKGKAYSKLFSGDTKTKNYKEYKGTFSDVKIAGNGTYTVSLKNADFAAETTVSQLHVATDIPSNSKIKFTNVKAKVNGRTIISFDKAYMETEKKYAEGGMVVLLINHWRAPLEKALKDKGVTVNGNGVPCLAGTGSDSIEITFTVSGFAYNKK